MPQTRPDVSAPPVDVPRSGSAAGSASNVPVLAVEQVMHLRKVGLQVSPRPGRDLVPCLGGFLLEKKRPVGPRETHRVGSPLDGSFCFDQLDLCDLCDYQQMFDLFGS